MARRTGKSSSDGPFHLYGLPENCSSLADAVFDLLKGGETVVSIFGATEHPRTKEWLEARAKHLADFLRSEEPIPPILRQALADAIDGNGDPPVRFEAKMGQARPRISAFLERRRKGQIGLEAYDNARASGSKPDDAKAEAAATARMVWRDLQPLIADARSERVRSAELKTAMEENKPLQENIDLVRSPFMRQKGRPPKPKG